MTNTVIPAGYRLTVHSWENDADNRQTHILAGLSIGELLFYLDFCKLLRSADDDFEQRTFGNMYDPSESEIDEFIAAIREITSKHIAAGNIVANDSHTGYMVSALNEELAGDDNAYFANSVSDTMSEFMGYSSDNFFTRVFDSHIVEYLPEPIEILNVTNEFPIEGSVS